MRKAEPFKCGMRKPKPGGRQPKLIDSERATESVWNTHLRIGEHKPPSSQRCALPQSPPVGGAVGGAGKETNGMPLARYLFSLVGASRCDVRAACGGATPSNADDAQLFVPPATTRAGMAQRAIPTIPLNTYLARRRRARAGAPKRPQTIGLQRVKRPLISFLTFPSRYGRLGAVMQAALSDQGRERGRRRNEDGSRDGAGRAMARGRRSAPSLPGKGKCGMEPRLPRLRGRVEGEVASEMRAVECGKCSLMFAYVRLCSLYWRKMFEASDGEGSSILQNARQTEMGSRGTRPSEYQRQRLARTKLDLGRARWMRGNAEWMNGKAKGLSDRNTFFIYDTDERGLGLEENLRLMGEKCLRPAFDCSGSKRHPASPRLW